MEIIQEVRKTQVQAIRIRQTTYTIWHGNVWEWTQEANNTKHRTYRGGGFGNNGSNSPVANRYSGNGPNYLHGSIRFSSHFNIEPVTPDSDTV